MPARSLADCADGMVIGTYDAGSAVSFVADAGAGAGASAGAGAATQVVGIACDRAGTAACLANAPCADVAGAPMFGRMAARPTLLRGSHD